MPDSSNAPTPTGAKPDDRRWWRAVLARDRRLDGSFVTAVLTTGIFCRPSCPARHPKRENVRFYPSPAEAERAGFRACLRCRPKEVGRPDRQDLMVERVCRHLRENTEGVVPLTALARIAGMSPHHLQRTFKRRTGLSPRQYAEALRLGRFKTRLKRKESVTMALYEAGYGSSSRLYERSSDRLGMTPGAYREGGRGMEIRYTVVSTPIGRVLVAATERGICSVRIGEPERAMTAALEREFSKARIRRDRNGLSTWVRALARHLEGEEPKLDLPVDVRATAFQWRVWEALRAIPYGETRTYREIAQRVGNAKAARAVGRACATNPVALVIPCHRVVREGGNLGGYAWGLGIKQQLLESERRGLGKVRRRS
jgi:AraC family transcriptional regulator of adaptative response/methylated-DNA-[protein]-cysteine methyltransferase